MGRVTQNIKEHWHRCPSCYEDHICNIDCTIIDFDDDNLKYYGGCCDCSSCEVYQQETKTAIKDDELTPEWWAKYTGVKKYK